MRRQIWHLVLLGAGTWRLRALSGLLASRELVEGLCTAFACLVSVRGIFTLTAEHAHLAHGRRQVSMYIPVPSTTCKGFHMDFPVPPVMEAFVVVVQLVPQGCIQKRIAKQLVDFPVPESRRKSERRSSLCLRKVWQIALLTRLVFSPCHKSRRS